jgi:hypothetical protein
MERREDIRAAIHRLLSNTETAAQASPAAPAAESSPGTAPGLTHNQLVTLRAVQASLLSNQIEADIPEIVHALLEALSTRPSLCRGLVAAYLLGA